MKKLKKLLSPIKAIQKAKTSLILAVQVIKTIQALTPVHQTNQALVQITKTVQATKTTEVIQAQAQTLTKVVQAAQALASQVPVQTIQIVEAAQIINHLIHTIGLT